MPALQLVAAVEPAKQKVPVGQLMQPALLCNPVWLPNVPPSHGSAALDPSKQYEPSKHGKVWQVWWVECSVPYTVLGPEGGTPREPGVYDR